MNRKAWLNGAGIAAIALAAQSTAYAQDAGADAAPVTDTAAQAKIEDIIVTARRRSESAQSVPIAIDAFTPETLQQNNINTLGDLQQLVPSLTINTSLSRDALDLGIRGQSSNGISGLPGVLAYLNEVPLPVDRAGNISGGSGLLFDLENIQVLKGPQGTLFGRNTLGGALLLQTARPKNEFGARIQVGYGNYNNREIDAAVNVPLVSDVLLARVAFNAQKRDGFTRILSEPGYPNGRDADARDNYSVRGTLSFRPSASFQNDTIITQTEFDSHGSSSLLTEFNPTSGAAFVFPSLAAMFAQQQALGVRTAIPINVADRSEGKLLAITNTSKLSLGDNLTFRNIFGYVRSQTTYQFDLDATSVPLIENPRNASTRTVDQFTEEVQLLGNSFGGKFDWILGGFFLDQPRPSEFVPNGITVFGGTSDIAYKQDASSKAVLGQGTYDLSSLLQTLKLTAGLRYTWDKTTNIQLGGGQGAVCVGPQIVNCDAIPINRSKDDALTWTLGLDIKPTPGTLVYLASRRGYRQGSSNIQVFPGIDPLFGPEFVTDVELGVKSDWHLAGIPIRTNAAAYLQKHRDIQVSETIVIPGELQPVQVTVNAASATLTGVELEISAQLTRALRIGGTFDYLKLHYDDFGPNVDAAQLQANVTTGYPRFKYGLNARYQLPIDASLGELSVGAVWNWQDKNGDTSQPGGVIDAYGLLNLSADWQRIGGGPVDVSLFGSNVTDKVYGVGTFVGYNTIGFSARTYGEPRMYGVRIKYHFGSE